MSFQPDKPSECTWSKDADPGSSPHGTVEWRRDQNVFNSILEYIGNTPLVKLNKIPQSCGVTCDVYVKCEYLNPGGSVKDRFALRAVLDAEESGVLSTGSTIIEPSSGNAGIGLALVSAIKGYQFKTVMSEKNSNEKTIVLKALGADVVIVPITGKDNASLDGVMETTMKLNDETPKSVVLNQYGNPSNPLAHYDGTAEEIMYALDDKIDMFVSTAGTGGTITGVGRKLKEKIPDVEIVGVDPHGSILAAPEHLNKCNDKFYEVEGIGNQFLPTVLDRGVVDTWIKSGDKESLLMTRRLIREEGLLCGTSSGAAVAVAMQAAAKLSEGQTCVVVLPDTIRNYLTKFVSDQWMEARFFQPTQNPAGLWWWDINISELKLNPIQTCNANTICHKVIHIMKKLEIHEVPIVNEKGSIIGVVVQEQLVNGLISKKFHPKDEVEKAMIRIFPKLDRSANLGLVSRLFQIEHYVIIVEKQYKGDELLDIPTAIVTPIDLLQYIECNKNNDSIKPQAEGEIN